LRTEKNWF